MRKSTFDPSITDRKRHAAAPTSGLRAVLLSSLMAATMRFAVVAADGALTGAQVKASLEAHGYTHVNDVKFRDGIWKADARSADGNRVDVRIDPKTGEIFPDEEVANLSEADVKARLSAAGYTGIHDVSFRNGIWNAKADNAAGVELELRLDPATGEVIGQDKD
ncbi:MAG: PepSY domain-containing protein [Lysobacteraceae bacterium]